MYITQSQHDWSKRTATHCRAKYCNTLQHSTTLYNSRQPTAKCITPQHTATATHYNTLQHIIIISALPQLAPCNTMQLAATHCNCYTLQHTATQY